MKKKLISLGTIGVLAGTIFTGSAHARQVGEFSNFTVRYSGNEAFTGYLLKSTTGRNGAINLVRDNGTAWITVAMKNSNGAFRGGTTLQRGTRAEFTTPNAQGGYSYRLGMRKTNNTGGGSVNISGSWSPDSY